MFETRQSEPGSGGLVAMQFLVHQIVAPISTMLVSYPIFRSIEMGLQQSSSEEELSIWVWRWTALTIPMIVGFGIGFLVQRAWPSATIPGRFVAILPTLLFTAAFVFAISMLSFDKVVASLLREGLTLEMWVGTIFYGLAMLRRVPPSRASPC